MPLFSLDAIIEKCASRCETAAHILPLRMPYRVWRAYFAARRKAQAFPLNIFKRQFAFSVALNGHPEKGHAKRKKFYGRSERRNAMRSRLFRFQSITIYNRNKFPNKRSTRARGSYRVRV